MNSDDIASLLAMLDEPAPAPSSTSVSQDDFANMLAMLDAPVRAQAAHGEGKSDAENSRAYRARKKARSLENIAVLDMETDPFDNLRPNDPIEPFLAVLYSDNFEPIVIWETDAEAFANAVVKAIEDLPEAYTIYAHNGGKFDYMFLLRKLRGDIMFKGRGIMTAQIGKHELRDSFHIIPDRLANFKKDHIDYANMKRMKRDRFRSEIIKYCINDCKYLLDIVKGFTSRFGMKLSIGQAAIAKLRESYKFETLEAKEDERLREFFFGGRVECLQGRGHFKGDYKLYDVNSMYPAVMANYEHPIGSFYDHHAGPITKDTIFIDLTCNSRGAFVKKSEDGSTNAPHGRHRFKTTIWEYEVALKHNLISDIEIHECIDNFKRTNFVDFIAPMYNERQHLKAKKDMMQKGGLEGTPEFDEVVKDDMFYKFLLNNAYGKFAQNPRKYKENLILSPGEMPPADAEWGDMPAEMCEDYWIWQRPNPSWRFNNVGTGASITGAARSVLLDAICQSKGAIYCDTDSLICLDIGDVKIHKTDLGAWDLEKSLSEVIICGKKLYSYTTIEAKPKRVTKAKGAGSILSEEQWRLLDTLEEKEQGHHVADMSRENMLTILNGGEIINVAKGVTLTKTGRQYYMKRRISATVKEDGPSNAQSIVWRGEIAGEPAFS